MQFTSRSLSTSMRRWSPSTGRWRQAPALSARLLRHPEGCRLPPKYAILRINQPSFNAPEHQNMRVDQAVNIEDLHRMAKRRLPKVAFDFIEGGLEDERGLDRNTAAFHKHHLLPRYLVDVSKRDQSATIFGQTFSSPFGISPTGSAGLVRRGADLMLAEAAREANIPYIMSGASNETIEDAARVAPKNAWYQLYAARDGKISEDRKSTRLNSSH